MFFWLDALLLTDREHWGSAEEERGMAAEIPGANIAPPPSHDPPQYFFGARSNQGESSELSWVRFWVIISPLLLTLLGCTLALKALGLASLCGATPSWHNALNIAPLKNWILYGQCTLIAPTSQGRPKKPSYFRPFIR